MSLRADRRVAGLSSDDVFDLLASPRRRFVVHYLRLTEGTAQLSEMARRIAAWENDEPVEEVTSTERKRVYTSLQQTHLEKLDEAGVVDYDASAGAVEPTPATDELEVYLEVVTGRGFPWREYYLALGAVGSALSLVAWQNLGPFAALPDVAVAALLAVVLTVSALAHGRSRGTAAIGTTDRPPEVDALD